MKERKRNIYCDPSKEKFDELLKPAGFSSRSELCRKIGMSKGTLENNLKGIYAPNVETIAKLASALEAPLTTVIQVFYPKLFDAYPVVR